MEIISEWDLLYSLIYKLRKKGIKEFNVETMEKFLYEESHKQELEYMFLDIERSPISKRVNLSGAISMIQMVRGLKQKIEGGDLICLIAPLLESPEFDKESPIDRIVDDYIVLTRGLSSELTKYVDRFYEPEFTAFNFVCLFASVLKSRGIKSFKSDDVEQLIIKCKKIELYEEILNEIKPNSNGIHEFSFAFQEAITSAKYSEILYSVSPEKDSTVFIRDEFDAGQILQENAKFYDTMLGFSLEYVKPIEGEKLSSEYNGKRKTEKAKQLCKVLRAVVDNGETK